MLTVLHATNTRDSMFYGMGKIYTLQDLVKAYKNGEYKSVATVDTTDIDKAYELTNSIHCGWWENDKVEAYLNGKEGLRSTSVGDLILDEDDNYYVVAGMGFEKIRLPHPATIKQN